MFDRVLKSTPYKQRQLLQSAYAYVSSCASEILWRAGLTGEAVCLSERLHRLTDDRFTVYLDVFFALIIGEELNENGIPFDS